MFITQIKYKYGTLKILMNKHVNYIQFFRMSPSFVNQQTAKHIMVN